VTSDQQGQGNGQWPTIDFTVGMLLLITHHWPFGHILACTDD